MLGSKGKLERGDTRQEGVMILPLAMLKVNQGPLAPLYHRGVRQGRQAAISHCWRFWCWCWWCCCWWWLWWPSTTLLEAGVESELCREEL